MDLRFHFFIEPVKKELNAECQFMEIPYVIDWGFLVCSYCSQLKCFHSSLECNERTLFGLSGCKWKPLHLNNYQITLRFVPSFSLLFRICPFCISFVFRLAFSLISVFSAGTNLTLGFLEQHVLLASWPQNIWLLTIYWHSQLLPVPFGTHRLSLTWAFPYWLCYPFFWKAFSSGDW
jgi:hypothetical protein